MSQTYYFLNYQKNNQLEEKCPSKGCGEEFLPYKGPQCSISCEDKQLEDRHREVTKLMIDKCLLPKYQANVDCPFDTPAEYLKREDKGWGWVTLYNKTIIIPWYTLRSREEFFDTVSHETAHITSTEIKFTSPSNQKIIAEFQKLENKDSDEGRKQSSPATLKYYKQNKVLIKNYKSGIHGKKYWEEEFKRLHGELMKSEYAKYNYSGSPPKLGRHIIGSQTQKSGATKEKYYDPNYLLWWK